MADSLGLVPDKSRLTMELGDAFWLYGGQPGDVVVWLDRAGARRLPPEVRRAQPAAHRWPTRDVEADRERTVQAVERGRRVSRHAELTDRDWERIAAVLPGARRIAGTFPEHSGPNCFGTVLAAAGVEGAEQEWVQVEPFEDWLAEQTTGKAAGDVAGAGVAPDGERALDPLGTVLVWREQDGSAAHAAVSLGGGYALHKPSQGWMSPVKVLTEREVRASSRATGLRLSRRWLT